MRKRGADALGALLSASFLSCLFALLLVAEQAFPPARTGDGVFLPAEIRGPLVVAGGSAGSTLAAPAAVVPAEVVPAEAVAAVGALAPVLDSSAVIEPAGPSERRAGSPAPRGERRTDRSGDRDPARAPDADRTDRKESERDGASPDPAETPGHGGKPSGHGGKPPGKGGTPPGQGGKPPGKGGTPPGQGGKPPGQGGTPPGQSKDKAKDDGGKGKGNSNH